MKKRLMSIDTLRGFAIFYVVILHALVMRVFEQDRSQIQILWDKAPTIVIILIVPFIIIMIWGSVFTFLSGISVAYSLATQKEEDKSKLLSKYKRVVVRGFLIIFVQYIFLFLFSNQISGNTEMTTHSLLTGYLETDIWTLPQYYHFVVAPTLEGIVISNMLLCFIFYIFYNRLKLSKKQIYFWLIAIGLGIIIVSSIIFNLIGNQQEIIDTLVSQKRYFEQMLFIKFIAGRYSFFPNVAYGIFGAVIGVALANKESYKSICKFGFMFSLLFIGIFLFSLFNEFDYVKDLAGEHMPMNVYIFNLGGQMLVMTILIKMDYSNPKMTKIHARNSKMLRRYGRMTLTLYFFEAVFSISLYKLFFWLNHGSFYTIPWLIASYEFIVFIFWYITLKIWERKNFALSVENVIYKLENWLFNLIHLINKPIFKVSKVKIS